MKQREKSVNSFVWSTAFLLLISRLFTPVLWYALDPGQLLTIHHWELQAFTHALYELAARPQYLAPLREEIEGVIERYGWSKMALVHMSKLDSFFKESQRVNGSSGTSSYFCFYAC